MSPASQGALEVERYIGSCLISSTVRPVPHKAVNAKKQEPPRGKPRYTQNYGPQLPNEQCQVQYVPGTWAGAPLISMTSSPRRNNQRSSPSPGQQQLQQQQQQQQLPNESEQIPAHLHNRSPLSRLAIHTQGAPLILAGRFHNRGKIHNNNINNNNSNANNVNASGMNGTRCQPSRSQRTGEPMKKLNSKDGPPGKDTTAANIANIDSLSIASDESSGSNNSENSLPRIIKPRKRRKKDRKPPNVAPEISKPDDLHNGGSEASSIVTLKPYVPVCYERYEPQRGHRRPPITKDSYGRPQSMQEIVDTRQRYHRHMVKVLDNNRNVVPPGRAIHEKNYRHGTQLLHEFNDVTGCEIGATDGPGLCQCRYCDPSGLIWDVDQNGYSPFLTPPPPNDYNMQYPHVPLFLSHPLCQDKAIELFDEAAPLYLERESTVLRRSWSDPTSYFSDEITPNRSVGVIGDRAPVETNRNKNSWRGSTSSTTSSVSNSSSGTSQSLEVSTEIVTSPNGHRDLEIKFYSSSPPIAVPEDKAIFPDDEDFSDIWSYHESKLQQDFRTLLQAEE